MDLESGIITRTTFELHRRESCRYRFPATPLAANGRIADGSGYLLLQVWAPLFTGWAVDRLYLKRWGRVPSFCRVLPFIHREAPGIIRRRLVPNLEKGWKGTVFSDIRGHGNGGGNQDGIKARSGYSQASLQDEYQRVRPVRSFW